MAAARLFVLDVTTPNSIGHGGSRQLCKNIHSEKGTESTAEKSLLPSAFVEALRVTTVPQM